jgi:hypothetical protein
MQILPHNDHLGTSTRSAECEGCETSDDIRPSLPKNPEDAVSMVPRGVMRKNAQGPYRVVFRGVLAVVQDRIQQGRCCRIAQVGI